MLEDTALSLLLQSILIFLSSTSATNLKFINEFVEVGGILTVIEVLNLSFATDVEFLFIIFGTLQSFNELTHTI